MARAGLFVVPLTDSVDSVIMHRTTLTLHFMASQPLTRQTDNKGYMDKGQG